jgi:plastocyanin
MVPASLILAKVTMTAAKRLRWFLFLNALLLGLLAGLTACTEPEGALEGGNQEPREEAASPALADAPATEVGLTEYEIAMPTSLSAGSQIFRVTNNGAAAHNFEIEGQGIEEKFEDNLAPGEIKTMQLDLEPGAYEVCCPVGNHREQGMETQLTVTQ